MSKVKKENKKTKYLEAFGRRKRSIARVRIFESKGENLVNDKPFGEYFSGEVSKIIFELPFRSTDTLGKYYITAKVEGGGKSGQLGALVHAISRALNQANPKFRSLLKKNSLLTRDPREKERRKPGYAQKARAKKQSPKR